MPDLLAVASERRLEVLESPLVVGCAGTGWGDGIFHFNVLCGENGWWVEFGIDVGDAFGSCYADLPGEGEVHDGWGKSLEDVMELIVETSMRRDSPILDQYEDPFGGQAPGAEWIGDWPDVVEWPVTA